MGGDPWALQENSELLTWYGGGAYPSAFFDGGNHIQGASGTVERIMGSYRNQINNHLYYDQYMGITGEISVNSNQINVEVSVFSEHTYPAGEYYLKSRILEDELYYQPTNMIYHNVVREFGDDIAIDLSQPVDQSFTLTFENPADDTWDLQHTSVVILVQDNSTKQVIQSLEKSIY